MEQQQPYNEKPELTGDEKLWFIGQQAEEVLKFLDESAYFQAMMEQTKLELCKDILGLNPGDAERFAIYKARLDGYDILLYNMRTDVEVGKLAKRRIDGEIPANREGIDLL